MVAQQGVTVGTVELEDVERSMAQLHETRRELATQEAEVMKAYRRAATQGAELREARQSVTIQEAQLKAATEEATFSAALFRPTHRYIRERHAQPATPLRSPKAPSREYRGARNLAPARIFYPPPQMPLLMQAQLQAADLYLIRLFCSFRPVPGKSPRGLGALPRLPAARSPGAPTDCLRPLPGGDITREVKRHLKVTLAPTLKFQAVEAEVGDLEFGLEYPELQPIIVGAGVGEAMPTWDYQTAKGMAGIQGAKWMHLLVKAPKGMPVGTAQLALTAQIYVDSVAAWLLSVAGPAEQGARLNVPLWAEPKIP